MHPTRPLDTQSSTFQFVVVSVKLKLNGFLEAVDFHAEMRLAMRFSMAEVLSLPVEFIGEPVILFVDDHISRRVLTIQSVIEMHVTVVSSDGDIPRSAQENSSFELSSVQNIQDVVSTATTSGSLQASFVQKASLIAADMGEMQGESDITNGILLNVVFSTEVPVVASVSPTHSPTPGHVVMETIDDANSNITFAVVGASILCLCIGAGMVCKYWMKSKEKSVASASFAIEEKIQSNSRVDKGSVSPSLSRKQPTQVLALSSEALPLDELDYKCNNLNPPFYIDFGKRDIDQNGLDLRSRKYDFDSL